MIRKLFLAAVFFIALCIILNHIVESGKFDNFMDKHRNMFFAPKLEYILAKYYMFSNKYGKAIKRFERIIEIYHGSEILPKAMYNLAKSNEELGNMKEAKEIYKRLVKEFPEHKLSELASKKLLYFK